MKIIIIFAIVSSLFSCVSENKMTSSEVKLTLKNKELNYLKNSIDTLAFDSNYNHYTIQNIFKSWNNIVYEIENKSENNVLFLMNPYKLSINSFSPTTKDSSTHGRVKYIITDELGNNIGANVLDFNTNTEEEWKILQKEGEKNLIKEKLIEKIGSKFEYDEIIQNSFVLKPKESVLFSVKLNLPLVEQPFVNNNFSHVHVLMSDKIYRFQLYYSLSKESRDLLISSGAIEELKKMNIKVFEGTLKSNIIKVMPN